MSAHIQVPCYENDESFIYSSKLEKKICPPATLSKRILTDLLRNKMGFKGLVVSDASDAMVMGAIHTCFDIKEAMIYAIKAGVNFILDPVQIKKSEDMNKLLDICKDISDQAETDVELKSSIDNSYNLILELQKKI